MSVPKAIKPKYVSWLLIIKSAYVTGEVILGFFEDEERYKKFLDATKYNKFEFDLGYEKKNFEVYRRDLKNNKLFLHEVQYAKI